MASQPQDSATTTTFSCGCTGKVPDAASFPSSSMGKVSVASAHPHGRGASDCCQSPLSLCGKVPAEDTLPMLLWEKIAVVGAFIVQLLGKSLWQWQLGPSIHLLCICLPLTLTGSIWLQKLQVHGPDQMASQAGFSPWAIGCQPLHYTRMKLHNIF